MRGYRPGARLSELAQESRKLAACKTLAIQRTWALAALWVELSGSWTPVVTRSTDSRVASPRHASRAAAGSLGDQGSPDPSQARPCAAEASAGSVPPRPYNKPRATPSPSPAASPHQRQSLLWPQAPRRHPRRRNRHRRRLLAPHRQRRSRVHRHLRSHHRRLRMQSHCSSCSHLLRMHSPKTCRRRRPMAAVG